MIASIFSEDWWRHVVIWSCIIVAARTIWHRIKEDRMLRIQQERMQEFNPTGVLDECIHFAEYLHSLGDIDQGGYEYVSEQLHRVDYYSPGLAEIMIGTFGNRYMAWKVVYRLDTGKVATIGDGKERWTRLLPHGKP